MIKRLFDILASGLAIIVFSPLLLPIIVVLRLTGEGEVFYAQQRIGRNGVPFPIYKFATMLKDSPSLPGGDITVGNDPRILPFGRFLRDTKLNELPQLFNIFLVDMSVIGWRPLTPRVAQLFLSSHWTALRNWPPGLSGVGSIVFRDEEALLSAAENREALYASAVVPYKSALEVWYTQHQSLWLDLKLMALTIGAVMNNTLDLSRHFPDLPKPPEALVTLRQRTN
jgi:lipopolysaccharide/colanic/teichoic acid biosynthesis glycosyltransferase